MKRNFQILVHLPKNRLFQRRATVLETDGSFEVFFKQKGRETPVVVAGYVGWDGTLTVTVDAGGATRFKVRSEGVAVVGDGT